MTDKLDKFDYEEPSCALCGDAEFYYPEKGGPLGRIPVDRVIDKIDGLYDKNNYLEANKVLTYWRDEAIALRDKRGELAMQSELIGYYRKQNEKENGLAAVRRALALIEELEMGQTVTGATVFINCATALHAFGACDEALPLYASAEKIYASLLPLGDARLGGLYNNEALTFASFGRFEDAEAAYFSALSVMERVDRGEAECAITYINLAHLYERWGKSDKIEPCMRKAYKLLQSENLPRDGYYAFVLEKCAPSFGYFGDTVTYEKLKKEAEEIYARA